jgi:hypothetical protein
MWNTFEKYKGYHYIRGLDKNLEAVLDSKVNTIKYKFMQTSGFTVIKPNNKEGMPNYKEQPLFKSSIGSLLSLVKLSHHNLANAVRKLSKILNNSINRHDMKLIHCSICFQKSYKSINMNHNIEKNLKKMSIVINRFWRRQE